MKSSWSEFYVDAWKETCTSNIHGVIEVRISTNYLVVAYLAK